MSKLNIQTITYIVIVLGSAFISSCATTPTHIVGREQIPIEKVSSRSAYFSKALVYSSESKLFITGELRKRIPIRGRIPGYVGIEIISPMEDVLYKLNASYHRQNRKSLVSKFSVDIPLNVEEVGTIRLIHHQGLVNKKIKSSPLYQLEKCSA